MPGHLAGSEVALLRSVDFLPVLVERDEQPGIELDFALRLPS